MMKLKKLIAAVASVVMTCAFATGAFADYYDDVRAKAAAQYPAYADVINSLDNTQVDAVKAAYGTFDAAAAAAAAVEADVKADPTNATQIVRDAVAAANIPNIAVESVVVKTNADGSVTATVTVNNTATGKSFTLSVVLVAATSTSEHPEIGEAIKNGTWGVDEKKATAAAATVSAPSGVIKATGDNTAVVLMMGALAIVSVLGLAVRKSDAET